MNSPRSSKKIYEAEKLNRDYQNYFGSYSASRSPGINSIIKSVTAAKKRMLILLGICVVVAMFGLYRSRPKWIMKHRRTYEEPDRISLYYLFLYSVFIGLFLAVIVVLAAQKFPKLRSLLFKDCDLCLG